LSFDTRVFITASIGRRETWDAAIQALAAVDDRRRSIDSLNVDQIHGPTDASYRVRPGQGLPGVLSVHWGESIDPDLDMPEGTWACIEFVTSGIDSRTRDVHARYLARLGEALDRAAVAWSWQWSADDLTYTPVNVEAVEAHHRSMSKRR
jgi:hypothetical protein